MPVKHFNSWSTKRYKLDMENHKQGEAIPFLPMYIFKQADGYILTNMTNSHTWYKTRQEAEREA